MMMMMIMACAICVSDSVCDKLGQSIAHWPIWISPIQFAYRHTSLGTRIVCVCVSIGSQLNHGLIAHWPFNWSPFQSRTIIFTLRLANDSLQLVLWCRHQIQTRRRRFPSFFLLLDQFVDQWLRHIDWFTRQLRQLTYNIDIDNAQSTQPASDQTFKGQVQSMGRVVVVFFFCDHFRHFLSDPLSQLRLFNCGTFGDINSKYSITTRFKFRISWLWCYLDSISNDQKRKEKHECHASTISESYDSIKSLIPIRIWVWTKNSQLIRYSFTINSIDLIKPPVASQFIYHSFKTGLHNLIQSKGQKKFKLYRGPEKNP